MATETTPNELPEAITPSAGDAVVATQNISGTPTTVQMTLSQISQFVDEGISGGTLSLTGDATANGPINGSPITITLVDVNPSGVGTFGDSTHSAVITINDKGLITNATAVAIAGGGGGTVTLSGDVTGTGAGTIGTTLAATNVTAGTYTNPTVTFDQKGRATSAVSGSPSGGAQAYYDVVIYSSTMAGIMAAVMAKLQGSSVAIFEPRIRKPGGMQTCGLDWMDVFSNPANNARGTMVGLFNNFLAECAAEYRVPIQTFWSANPFQPSAEGKVSETILARWLKRYDIPVFTNAKILSAANVTMGTGPQGLPVIQSVTFDTQGTVSAKAFVDASYEGDLMAFAGCSYTIGRESTTTYGESLAGMSHDVLTSGISQQFGLNAVDPYVTPGVSSSGLLPGISSTPYVAGSSDPQVQSMGYRLTLAGNVANQNGVALGAAAPSGYSALNYELLGRNVANNFNSSTWNSASNVFNLQQPLWSVDGFTNKRDANVQGPVSMDYLGTEAREYIDGGAIGGTCTWTRRAQIDADIFNWTKGLFYFLRNDSRLSGLTAFQTSLSGYQLCNDEFLDSQWGAGFSPFPYVREGRRVIGDSSIWGSHSGGTYPQLVQGDLTAQNSFADPIAYNVYYFDKHAHQRVVIGGQVYNEGTVIAATQNAAFYAAVVPYRVLLPQQAQCSNLFVPCCPAVSNICFASLRLEPVYSAMGQAAGLAASMVAQKGCSSGQISTNNLLQQEFQRRNNIKQRNALSDGNFVATDGTIPYGATNAYNGGTINQTGFSVGTITGTSNVYCPNATSVLTTTTAGATCKFTPNLQRSTEYSVYAHWLDGSSVGRATALEIQLWSGTTKLLDITVNQNNTGDGGDWYYLGDFVLPKGTSAYAMVIADSSGNPNGISAFKFVPGLRGKNTAIQTQEVVS